MIEPRILPTAVEHRIQLQCTPRDLRLLADLADAALAQRSGCHIHVVSLRGVCLHLTLDRDRAIAEAQAPARACVRSDWRLPDPPACPKCAKLAKPAVAHTGEGWTWGWECEEHGPEHFWWDEQGKSNVHAYPWPFIENHALGSDWQRLGFLLS